MRGKLIATLYEFSGRTAIENINLARDILYNDPDFDYDSVQSNALRYKMAEFEAQRLGKEYEGFYLNDFLLPALGVGVAIFIFAAAALNLGFMDVGNSAARLFYAYFGGYVVCFLLHGAKVHYLAALLLSAIIFYVTFLALKGVKFYQDRKSSYSDEIYLRKRLCKRRR